MNPFIAVVFMVIGVLSMVLSVYVIIDQIRCYKRRDLLSGMFGIALVVVGIAVAVSCFAALRRIM